MHTDTSRGTTLLSPTMLSTPPSFNSGPNDMPSGPDTDHPSEIVSQASLYLVHETTSDINPHVYSCSHSSYRHITIYSTENYFRGPYIMRMRMSNQAGPGISPPSVGIEAFFRTSLASYGRFSEATHHHHEERQKGIKAALGSCHLCRCFSQGELATCMLCHVTEWVMQFAYVGGVCIYQFSDGVKSSIYCACVEM